MKNCLTPIFSLLLFVAAYAQTPTPTLVVFATGFTRPCDIAHCNDDRLFVVEQGGKIWILDKDGNKLATPFLDIDARVGSSGNEQGLLGLTFHPNYPATPHFYVNYTDNDGDTRVSRFSVSATDPNLADSDSELVLLTAAQPFSNHNGGCVKFGPDGYLYIGLGDGGSGGDPQANGQKPSTFLGKMLRIDVDGGSPYVVPTDNPFLSDPNTLDEIWALGLRNPWRFSFDRMTGDLWIGDVGQDAWEEIDFQPASSPGGENYGWRCYEGTHTFNTNNCPDLSTLTFPVAEYPNSGAQGCSITGGFVYRGFQYPNLYGRYLYTDYCTGKLWSILPSNPGWNNEQIADLVNNQLVSFGENSRSELFLAGNGGTIWSLEDSSEEWSYTISVTQPSCQGTNDGTVEFFFSGNAAGSTVHFNATTGTEFTNLPGGVLAFNVVGPNGSSIVEQVVLTPDESLSGTVTGVTCPGDTNGSIDLTLGGTPLPTASSVIWSNGSTDLDLTGLAAGEYTVTVTTTGGCVIEETFVVEAGGLSSPPFVSLSVDSLLQTDDVFGFTYQWLLDGEPISGANSPTYTATENGTYSVQVIAGVCTYLSNEVVVNLTAVRTLTALTSVSVTPNPFQQSLLLTIGASQPMQLDIVLKDLQGRSLFTDQMEVVTTATRTLSLGNIPAGTYLLVLKNDKGEWVERVVKL